MTYVNPDWLSDQIAEAQVRGAAERAAKADRVAAENKRYAKVIAEKHLRDAQCYEEFRAHDQVEWVKTRKTVTSSNVKLAEDAFADAEAVVAAVSPVAVEARTEFEKISSRLDDAEGELTACKSEYDRRVQAGAAARDVGDALAAVDRAERVLKDLRKQLDKPGEAWGKALADAESELAEAAEYLKDCERDLKQARLNAKATPGEAPISDVTIRFNAAYMASEAVYGQLSAMDRDRVRAVLFELYDKR